MSDRSKTETELDVKLMAYADGALDAEAAAEVEAFLEREPELKAKVARHARVAELMKAAYAPVMDEPVPDRFVKLVRESGRQSYLPREGLLNSIQRQLGSGGEKLRPFLGIGVPQIGAMAACLMIGILVGKPLWQSSDGPFQAFTGMPMEITQTLFKTLENRPAGRHGVVEIGLTYQDHDGSWCRTFQLHRTQGHAGIACNGPDGWAIDFLVPAESGGEDDGFRMAGSSFPEEIIKWVEKRSAGEPMTQSEEKALLDRHWR